MSEENSNTQTQQAVPVPPAGPSVEEVKAQLHAEFEKTREGLIRDLQQERSKRQELEQRLSPPAPSPVNQDVSQDELGKVLTPYLAPALRKAEMLEARLNQEKAKSFLTAKTGKKWEDIEADKTFQDRLTSVAARYKLMGTPDDVVQRAYDIMELEEAKAEKVERARAAAASQHASIQSGTPPAPVVSGKEYSASDFNAMPSKEFDSLSRTGNFRKVGDKFVYTPR